MCRDHVEDPAFALYTSELAAGFWPFYNLLFAICALHAQLFFIFFHLFLLVMITLYNNNFLI